MEKYPFVERDCLHINMEILWQIIIKFKDFICTCFAFLFNLSGGVLDTKKIMYTHSCSIVFGVAGWTTTMEVLDECGSISKRILTKHFF